jgi:hypothetical protein
MTVHSALCKFFTSRSGAARPAIAGMFVLAALVAAGSLGTADASWSTTGVVTTGRFGSTLTLLDDGRLLAAGGKLTLSGGEAPSAAAAIYDPGTGAWTPAASMGTARYTHAATLMADGRVMVSGGLINQFQVQTDSVEFYDPALDTWSPGTDMEVARVEHSALTLPDGRVLVTGDRSDQFSEPEIYDPSTTDWTPLPAFPDHYAEPGSLTLLADGRVFLLGEAVPFPNSIHAILYDPVADTWSVGAQLLPRRHSAPPAVLPDGRIAVAGGDLFDTAFTDVDVYDTAADTWADSGHLSEVRADHATFALSNGLLLVAGGHDTDFPVQSAELFDPATGATSPLPPPAEPRDRSTSAQIDGCAGMLLGGVVELTAPNTAEVFDAVPPGSADTDADCLGDEWEALHGCLTVGVNDATGDPEGDGLNQMSEQTYGGNPCADDGDGCHDLEEVGADKVFGGQRDPFSPWDFFDVPAPAGPDLGADGKMILTLASARNKVISLQDVGVVLAYVGRTPANPAYTQDNNADGTADGEQMDRTPSMTPAEPWRSGPPNNGVSLQDVAVALAQVGHHCDAAP